ncbi:MAG: TVP38/TMEM64 family protein [Rhizobiales bacterium]|nr:TVP38/TMEM64 family protein [Hyphomicrobiales bacterium]
MTTADDQPDRRKDADRSGATPPARKVEGAIGPGAAKPAWRRYLPILVLAGGLAAGYAAGLHEYLSLSVLAEQREDLLGFVDANYALSLAVYFLVYVLAVAFSFPAASVLTIFGGFLFGWLVGGIVTAFAATLGATAVFLAAKSAFGDVLRQKAGGFLNRLADGFEKDALSYLFVLRLAPVFPFFVINIAPAFFGVPLRTYLIATFFGILPGTFAYSWLGQGVDSVLLAAADAGREVSVGDLVTPEITIAFVALALVAAIPPVLRRLRGPRNS